MGLPKGKTNNPAGRKPGSRNKRSEQWDALVESISGKHADRFNDVLNKASDKDFGKLYVSILQHFKPKLANTTIDAKVGVTKQDLNDIFPEENEEV